MNVLSSIARHTVPLPRLFGTRIRNLSQWKVATADQLPAKVSPHYVFRKPSLYSLIWDAPPQNVLVVKKPWNSTVRTATADFVKMLAKEYPQVNIILEEGVVDEMLDHDLGTSSSLGDGPLSQAAATIYTGPISHIREKADLMVTIGGDGTVLHATSLFSSSDVPPILSFSLGTVGFLLPFDLVDAHSAFKDVYSSQSTVFNRVRLKCETEIQTGMDSNPGSLAPAVFAMNDLNIHRGPNPHLTMLDIHVDGQFVTRGIADGVIVSTPTGSTAYSLSAGGSICHPSVPCTLITPICPRSLSFRPLIFPSTSKISISMSSKSRGQFTELSIDGISRGLLRPGDTIHVESEVGLNKGLWCVCPTEGEWVKHLNELLGFNSSFGARRSDI